MRLFLPFIALLCISFTHIPSLAQEVTVVSARKTIDGQKLNGQQIDLVLAEGVVEKEWKNHLRQYGKVKRDGSVYTVMLADIPGLAVSSGNLWSMVSKSGKAVTLWWAIEENAGEYVADSPESGNAQEAGRILHDFGVQAYHRDIQTDIDDAERAVSRTVRDYDLNVRFGERLQAKLDRQERRQEKLQQRLLETEQEQERLKAEIEQNRLDQEKSLKDIDKMRQVKESTKDRLGEVR